MSPTAAADARWDRRILVTGGAGFIASHVVLLLVKKYPNYKVRAVRLSAGPLSRARARLGRARARALGPAARARGVAPGSALTLRPLPPARADREL